MLFAFMRVSNRSIWPRTSRNSECISSVTLYILAPTEEFTISVICECWEWNSDVVGTFSRDMDFFIVIDCFLNSSLILHRSRFVFDISS